MNLLEGGKGEEREGGGERVGRGWRERGWGGRVGRGDWRGERGEGGMNRIHILIGMFNSNPMIPQYLNNNLT